MKILSAHIRDVLRSKRTSRIAGVTLITTLSLPAIALADCNESLADLDSNLTRAGTLVSDGKDVKESDLFQRARDLRQTAEILGRRDSDDACVKVVNEAQEMLNTVSLPSVFAVENLVGRDLVNPSGETLGEIENIMVDLEHGVAAYALVAFGGFLGFGEDLIPVPFSAMSAQPNGDALILSASTQRLEGAPRYTVDEKDRLSQKAWARSVYRYFGENLYWNAGSTESAKREELVASLKQSLKTMRAEKQAMQNKERVQSSQASSEEWRTATESRISELESSAEDSEVIRDQISSLQESSFTNERNGLQATIAKLEQRVSRLETTRASANDGMAAALDGSNASKPDEDQLAANMTDDANGSKSNSDGGNGGNGGNSDMEQLFDSLDEDNNGEISSDEAKREFTIMKRFDELDADGNGSVAKSEFKKVAMTHDLSNDSEDLIPKAKDAKPEEAWTGGKVKSEAKAQQQDGQDVASNKTAADDSEQNDSEKKEATQ